MAELKEMIRIGDRVITLAQITMMKIENSKLVNIFLADGRMEQFDDDEAQSIIGHLPVLAWDITRNK